ncbi:MAG: MFS transporter [Prolixibacteraceae bacterium]|jgi:OPA family glycerol-3-phosphate transporter-like MFS transporter|nr:MFS transporter [Prolixibacteraceae bacterium]
MKKNFLLNLLNPPAPKELLPEDKIDSVYKKMRLKVFLGAFIGYAGYYLVRKNLAIAIPGMIQPVENGGLGYNKLELGIALSAISIAYAFSKFLMGALSDRSDARKFLVIGLILSASLMMSVGIFPFATSSVAVIFMFMLIIGWLGGMGWPPCGRVMVHWFSHNERSFKMSIWNTSHTFGSGLMGNLTALGAFLIGGFFIVDIGNGVLVEQTWRSVFVFPSAVALLIAGFCWWALRDTPQSCGLPPIDQYRNDFPVKKELSSDKKIPAKELFIKYIFKNKTLWLIALANIFVYLVRYGIGDWSPTYCQESGLLTSAQSKMAFALHNYAGVPGTILCGLISAKLFKGRCAPANFIYMLLVLVSIFLYWKAAPVASFIAQTFSIDPVAATVAVVYTSLIAIGFFIYGPVALIGVQAINLVPKNAAGTAAGFVGLFGYLIGDALLSKVLIGAVADNVDLGWNATFWIFIVASILAAFFSATTWKREKAACALN